MFNSLVRNLWIKCCDIKHCPMLILNQLLHHARQVNLTLFVLLTLLVTGVLTGSETEQVQDGSRKMIHVQMFKNQLDIYKSHFTCSHLV